MPWEILPLLINKALREASRPTIRGVRGAEPPAREARSAPLWARVHTIAGTEQEKLYDWIELAIHWWL